jgi:hypothetical protein
MVVNGQLHAAAAFFYAKESPVPTGLVAAWVPVGLEAVEKRKICVPVVNRTPSRGHPASSPSLYRLSSITLRNIFTGPRGTKR